MRNPSTSSGRSWSAHLRDAFHSTALDADIVEELAQHAEATYDELRADGFSEAEALEKVERLIDGWRTNPDSLHRVIKRSVAVIPPAATGAFATGALADVSYGLRLLRKSPGYSTVTILTIALGVGAVTTLFSVAYGVLLRPLPWGDTERLVRLSESRGGREGRVPGTMMNGTYLAWAEAPQTLEAIGYYSGDTPATLTVAGESTRIPFSRVTPSTIALLGVSPL
jgi:putative ABC transport system permease protein